MKKGFSLLVLAIVVVVLLIIVTATTIGVSNVQKNVRTLAFATELSIVQDKVNLYYRKNNEYPVTNSGATIDINVSQALSQYTGEVIEGESVTLHYLDLEKIYTSNGTLTDEIHSLNYGLQENENDVYLISTTTGRVYYKDDVEGYHTLTDELKEKIGYVEESKDETVSIANIVFEKSKYEFTNLPIVTTIKVPNDYGSISCKIYSVSLNGTEITNPETIGNYKVYTTPNNINSNYYIVVSYTDSNSLQNDVTYSVDNYDNTAPHVEIVGNKKQIQNNVTGDKNSFYYIDYYDSESGVKEVKYANLKVEADVSNDTNNLSVIREYMKLYGKNVDKNILNIDEGTRWITVYIKDEAGNESYIYKQVPEIEKTATTNINSSAVEIYYDEEDSHDLVSNP